MTTIIVEEKYKTEFQNICKLLKGGFLGDRHDGNAFVTARVDSDGQSIIDGDHRYVLGKGVRSSESGNVTDVGKDGFNWFKGLRDYTLVSEKSNWEELMEKVARTYHKLYSLVEYKEKKNDVAEERALDECTAIVGKIYDTFLPSRSVARDVRSASEDVTVDYYGVTLRADISGSTGASVPILCKAYFKRAGNRLEPVGQADAEEVENYLNQCVEDASHDRNEEIRTEPIDAKDNLIPLAIDAVDRLLKTSIGNGIAFQDAIFFAGETDKNEIAQLVSQTAHDGAILRCVSAKILGISHVKWNEHAFDVYENGKRTFRMMVGLNSIVTMRCVNCGELVIDKNLISFTEDGERRTVMLHPSVTNFGLTQNELQMIADSKVFEKHNYVLSCPENFRNKHCNRVICLGPDKVFEVTNSKGEVRYHCKDCPYTEISYTDKDGNRHYTPTLSYACDVRDMVDAETVHACSMCGRNIQASENARCPLCSRVGIKSGDKEARALYKQLKNMLPLSYRLFAKPSQKFAYDDQEVIIFCINNKRYIIEKAHIKDSGLNGKPRRIK